MIKPRYLFTRMHIQTIKISNPEYMWPLEYVVIEGKLWKITEFLQELWKTINYWKTWQLASQIEIDKAKDILRKKLQALQQYLKTDKKKRNEH